MRLIRFKPYFLMISIFAVVLLLLTVAANSRVPTLKCFSLDAKTEA